MKKTIFILAFLLGLSLSLFASDEDSTKLIQEYVAKGRHFFKKKKYDEALHSFDKALELNPKTNKDNYYYYKADALDYLGRYSEAIAAYDSVITMRKWQITPILRKAYVQRRNIRDYEGAIKTYSEADIIWQKVWKDVKSSKSGRHKQSIEFGIGNSYIRMADYTKAQNYADSLLKINSENAVALELCEDIYCKLNDYESAYKISTQLISLYPRNARYLNMASASLLKLKRYNEARAMASKARGLVGSNQRDWSYVYLGQAYEALGDLGAAMECYDSAIEKNKKNSRAWVLRGELKLKQGDKLEAKYSFEEVLRLNPSSFAAQEALMNLDD